MKRPVMMEDSAQQGVLKLLQVERLRGLISGRLKLTHADENRRVSAKAYLLQNVYGKSDVTVSLNILPAMLSSPFFQMNTVMILASSPSIGREMTFGR